MRGWIPLHRGRGTTESACGGVFQGMDGWSETPRAGLRLRSIGRLIGAGTSGDRSRIGATSLEAPANRHIAIPGDRTASSRSQECSPGLKRAFDLLIASVALVAATPVLAIASLMILMEDGRPVLFVQPRVGQNGRLFEMLKLRTMVRGAESLQLVGESLDTDRQLVHKRRDDARVTKIGRILRRLSIDELPQLVNVLIGDMSLVGPRPELPRIVSAYEPWQFQRLAIPQGITGWWQVSGRSDRPMHLHTEDDVYYLRNRSFWLDLRILLQTIWIVLIGRGAY